MSNTYVPDPSNPDGDSDNVAYADSDGNHYSASKRGNVIYVDTSSDQDEDDN